MSLKSISFDDKQQLFLLQMHSSFYAMRILSDGQLAHVGSGACEGSVRLSSLDQYETVPYVWEINARRYELPTFGDTTNHPVGLKLQFPELAGPLATGDAAHLPVRDLRLRYQDHRIVTDAQPGLAPAHGKPTRNQTPRQTLVIHLSDITYDFHIDLHYRVTPEHDVIERWITLRNQTRMPVRIDRLVFGTVHFPAGKYELTRPAGAWAREFVAARQPLPQGETTVRQIGLNTGHEVNPFYLLNQTGQASESAGEVFFGALAYSGNWELQFDALLSDQVRVHGGYESSDFELILAPGEVHTTPAFVHGVAANGWGGASRRLHRLTRDYVLPAGGDRPVLFNGWEATYFDLKLDHQIQLSHRAAEMGVELFCVDDGWFGARRDDRAGLGDWVVAKDLFPRGLRPLVDEVLKLGMRFGLWVEPEMVNPDSDLYRAHPDWVLHFPGRPRTTSRNQMILDFGRPEVVQAIHSQLDALLREYPITFFKWDANRYATEPGSVAGAMIWRKHVEGVYHIMDTLRRDHPNLDIQSCSGGGGRCDLGILARCDQAWTSDNTDAFDRTYIQDGFSLAYPPRVMESWVTHAHNHQTGRPSTAELRFDVAMRGALGIGSNIDQLSAEELALYKRKISFYKRIRPIVQQGDLHRLAVAQEGEASVWQFVTTDGSRSVYSAVINQKFLGHTYPYFRLRGLRRDADYRIIDEHGTEIDKLSGSQLMSLGISGDQQTGGFNKMVRSRTLLLETAD